MALTTQVKDKIKIIKVDKTSCSKAYFLFSLLFVVCFYIISGRIVVVFFFQAEDGIRGLIVTGVQTCALPISPPGPVELGDPVDEDRDLGTELRLHLADRKSVVSGKSVDLGGRRIIKKKKRITSRSGRCAPAERRRGGNSAAPVTAL